MYTSVVKLQSQAWKEISTSETVVLSDGGGNSGDRMKEENSIVFVMIY